MLRAMRVPEIPSPTVPTTPQVEPAPIRRLEAPVVFVAPAWEYRILDKPADVAPDEAELNALGAEGWELAGVSSDAASVRFYFKRQLR